METASKSQTDEEWHPKLGCDCSRYERNLIVEQGHHLQTRYDLYASKEYLAEATIGTLDISARAHVESKPAQGDSSHFDKKLNTSNSPQTCLSMNSVVGCTEPNNIQSQAVYAQPHLEKSTELSHSITGARAVIQLAA